MPIFYKKNQRVLFVHIPKTAGISVYGWFYNNGWNLSNIKFGKMTTDLFNEKYHVSEFVIEGLQANGIPPQHAHLDIYKNWGEFTSTFTIVRNPLNRFISEINYYFKLICYSKKIHITNKKSAIFFANEFSSIVLKNYYSNPCTRENHIRHQIDFINEKTEILFFENDWTSQLAETYKLKGKPLHINKGQQLFKFSELITTELKNNIIDFYKKDYQKFNYINDI